MPNDTGDVPPERRADVERAALEGLRATPKTLPPMLFYDEEGCRLFYAITDLPEYYLTRTEMALLRSVMPDLLPLFAGGTLVEFGGSDETKARLLLDAADARFSTYVSIDVAGPALQAMQRRMRKSHPRLRVETITADFMQPLELPIVPRPLLGFFPGSTVGNLSPEDAVAFMAAARRSLGAGAWLLLGADLRKSPDILLPAYNDAAGITAAFNLNLLRRLNREADADFDLEQFRHEAIWNPAASRIEMHLVANSAQVVHLGQQEIRFNAGETIHTENSHKWEPETILQFAKDAGWGTQRIWQDRDGLFGLFLLKC